jgi:cytochrome b6-f complex iron-sulfur subunit
MAIHSQEQKRIRRRQFLGLAWAVAVVALVGQAGAALLDFFKPRAEPGAFGTKVTAGTVAEFQPGTVNHVRKGRFYLSRLEDGGMIAMWHQCTHLGCTVPWRESENRFHCPCHSSIFDTTGEVISGPAPRPLDLFPIELEGDQVVVDTGKPVRRDHFEPSQATYV